MPDSPCRSTVARVGAAVTTVCIRRRMIGLSPTIWRSLRNSITSRRSAVVLASQPDELERLVDGELELLRRAPAS